MILVNVILGSLCVSAVVVSAIDGRYWLTALNALLAALNYLRALSRVRAPRGDA